MPEKIIYYFQRYRPAYEAISKEVKILSNFFKKRGNTTTIHNLHLENLLKFRFNKNIISYHFIFYPLTCLFVKRFSKKYNLRHIYSNLGDLPYLTILKKKPLILTGAASCNIKKLKNRLRKLKKVSKIIVEAEKQKKELISLGIDKDKIEVIYPTVDDNFSYKKPSNKQFTILYASCPTRKEDFRKRGINLIIETAKNSKDLFYLAWRKKSFNYIKDLIHKNKLTNIKLTNEISKDMNSKYAESHCTIIPYTKFDDFLKLIPNSAIESLAAGKPLLVSNKTEIAKIVEKENCGIVFEPNTKELSLAIKKLKKDYNKHQKNCLKTFKEYFSQDIFLRKYSKIYKELDPRIKC